MPTYKKSTCPNWLRKAYRKAVKYTCQGCHEKEEEVGELVIHRIVRGNVGGTYEPNNCKIICKKCHKMYHSNEFK